MIFGTALVSATTLFFGLAAGQDTAGDLTYKAHVAYDASNYAQAIELASKALVIYPESAEAYFIRAQCYDMQDAMAKALADVKKAVEIDRNHRNLEFQGYIKYELRNYDEALKDLLEAVQMNTECPVGHQRLGRVYRALGKEDKAVAEFTSSIWIVENNFDYSDYRQILARSYSYLGQINEGRSNYVVALEDYGKAIENESGRAFYHLERGKLYVTLERYQLALTDLTNAISLDAKMAMAYAIRAKAYRRQDRVREALADARRGASLDPKNVDIQLQVAYACQYQFDYARAAAEFQKAYDLSPKSDWILGTVGWCKYMSGDKIGGEAAVRKTLAGLPNEPDTNLSIGHILAIRNKWTEAQPYYAKALTTASKYQLVFAIKELASLNKKKPANALTRARSLLAARIAAMKPPISKGAVATSAGCQVRGPEKPLRVAAQPIGSGK